MDWIQEIVLGGILMLLAGVGKLVHWIVEKTSALDDRLIKLEEWRKLKFEEKRSHSEECKKEENGDGYLD